MCHKKKNDHRKTQQQHSQKGQQRDLETKTLTVVSDDGEPEIKFLTMYPVKMTSVKPINGQSLDMELNTGASVQSKSTYFKLCNSDSRPTLKPSKVCLKEAWWKLLKLVTRVNTCCKGG